ncbi:MAG: copper chaperone PCu(A)C [Zetaproteobacteria bacterium]|nr:MAG: copper chaperone PCu(A)C [Zetaproteobacteria bacterium]
MKFRLLSILLLVCWSLTAQAGEVEVRDAWVSLPPPGAEVVAAYMVVLNMEAQGHRLRRVSCDEASEAEFHAMRRHGNMMQMVHLEGVDLPAGERVVFAPGGMHIMLRGLRRTLKRGEDVHLHLFLEDGRRLDIAAPVRDMR